MWMYPSAPMRGNKDRDKHDKESVLINAGIVMQKQTNLRPSTAKAKDMIIPRAHEGQDPPDNVHTACFLYECTPKEIKDKRWGLKHETSGRAGNSEHGSKYATWMPVLEAYTLTEQCPEIVQPASFKTGILAGHLLGDKTLAKKRATVATDSLRRRHP